MIFSLIKIMENKLEQLSKLQGLTIRDVFKEPDENSIKIVFTETQFILRLKPDGFDLMYGFEG